MAVAAETIRSPQSEMYGRSLSTVHRLGAFIVGKTAAESIHSPEAEQARAEFYTSVEEGFGTDTELGGGLEVRDFDFRAVIDGRAMAKDLKTPVSDMTEAGVICAEATAEADPDFLPQLTRSYWDHHNAERVDEMARGETDYNTRIVISPFPEEAAAESGDDYWRNIGYVPHLRRGFVQLYHATEEGVVAGSLSFDGSDKRRLREILGQFGVNIPEGETTDNWLQYAVTANLSEARAKELATDIANQASDPRYAKTTNTVEVTSDHQTIMDTVFSESYVHICESLFRGHQTPETRGLIFQLADKAQHFNPRFRNALYQMRAGAEQFTDDDWIVLHELLVYSTIEMMRALHLQKTAAQDGFFDPKYIDPAVLQSLDAAAFQNMLSNYGMEGARNNRVYSACGLAISPGEDNPGNSPQRAFGGNDETCPEVKNGQITRCPHCRKTVKAIVPDRKKIYCSNAQCKLVAPGLAHKNEKSASTKD